MLETTTPLAEPGPVISPTPPASDDGELAMKTESSTNLKDASHKEKLSPNTIRHARIKSSPALSPPPGYQKLDENIIQPLEPVEIRGHKRNSSSDLKYLSKVLKPSLKKNVSDAPISKELEERARSAPLVKKFNLPPTETLINDYSAALLKHILIHGRMYVSQNYICFESKIFGIKTMEIIPFKDITVLSKKSRKLNFARGIEISTPLQTYYFASFVSRVRAFELLTQMWRQHVPKDENHPDEDDSSEDDDDTQDYESDDSALKKKGGRLSRENTTGSLLKLGRSVECSPDHLEKELANLKEKGLRRFSSPLLNRVMLNGKSISTPNMSSSLSSNASSTNTDTGQESDSGTTSSAPPLEHAQITVSVTSSISEPASAPESEEEDDGNYDEDDGFLGSEASYQPVLNTTFDCSVKGFFKIFFSDESTFTHTYRENRGDKEVTVKKWTNSPQFGNIRDVLFLSPVRVPLGPSQTRATETQRYHLSKNRLLVDTVTMFLDIPYGDTFRIEGKWDVTPVTADSSRLVISVGVHFMKKTWFKSKIETQTIKETKESFQQWANLAQTEVARAQKSGILSHATLPPSQPNSEPPSAQSSPLITPSKAATLNITTPSPLSTNHAVESPIPSPTTSTAPAPAPTITSHRWRAAGGSGSSSTNLVNREGGRFAVIFKTLSSLTSSTVLDGQSLGRIAIFLVVGLVFFQMYLRIVYLEGKVSTLENILQPMLVPPK